MHLSWQIAAVMAGILVGCGLSLIPETAGFAKTIWLAVAGLLLIIVFYKQKVWTIIIAVIAGLLIGMWRGTIERVDMSDYGEFINQNVVLIGRVFEDPTVNGSSELRLRLSEVVIDDKELPGQVWVSVLGHINDVKRSDLVEIEGKLKTGFGTFPASMSFARLTGIKRSPNDDPARDMRDAFGEQLSQAVEGPAKDLGMGILAGEKTALPMDISDAFRIAGLTHIVVASGYNLTILIRFARRLFSKVSRLLALIGASGLVFVFACVTGFSPSMTRASLVAFLSLLAWYFGRKFHPVILLLFVAAVTVLINPTYVWGDAGWYMSFLSFVGVIILAPLVKEYFWKPDNKKHSIRQVFIETMSAQLMAVPVIALFMGQFAPYGLLANLLVLPIVPLTMLLTFIAGIVGWLIPPIATIVGWPAQKLLDYIIWISGQVSELPGALIEIDFGIWAFVGVMAVELLVIIYLRYRTKFNLYNSNVIE